jgi:hypothetical protein
MRPRSTSFRLAHLPCVNGLRFHRAPCAKKLQESFLDFGVGRQMVDSRFKCDTELTIEGLQGGLEGEAFAGRGVEGPEQGAEVAMR